MSAMTIEQHTAGEQTERLDELARLSQSSREGGLSSQSPPPGQYLTLEEGGQRRLLALEQEITHIGRGFHCELRLEDQSVSRRHAIIMRRLNSTRILDDRSSNGTYVNGRRINEASLTDGDVIVLGRVILGYLEVPEHTSDGASRA
ncbi:MAG: FHA domain-containing protein [Solirubrobacteraceae bacterium]